MHANHSSSAMDMSVLERQRSLVQRLYQQQQQLQHCPQIMVNENPMLLPPKMNDHSYFNGNLQNFPMYGASQFGFPSSPDLLKTCFETDSVSTISPKKRKAESEVKEECNDKGIEGEAARESQSGISVKSENENSKVSEVNKKSDYIHVRARRGQATDNHSLAERARREKISKKMRCLQELVPGCNKVTGKACMLDEIIYYVQSLQKQVEFLSMKLGDVNPRLDLNVDNLFAKELPAAYITSFPTPLDTANSNYFQLQQGGMSSCSIDTLTNGAQMMIPQRRDTSSSSISTPELHLVSSFIHQVHQQPQLPSWESDWQNLYNVNFH